VILDRRLADGHCLLAETLVRLGSGREAENHYREALLINENYITARLGLGTLLRTWGRGDEAEAEFRRVLDLDPTNPVAHLMLEPPDSPSEGAGARKNEPPARGES
jgi:Flp pilus assembly protein TadD